MKKLAILLFLTTITNLFAGAQDIPEKISSGLAKWSDDNPQEKMFVQTDRETYVAGESVWFKAWCTLNRRPSFLSRTIYVVLSDANGNVADKKMLLLDSSSSANGLMELPTGLQSGTYLLTAYTLWMLNFPDFIFQKPLFIYGSDYAGRKSVATKQSFVFDFFPEGGDLVEGLKNRVAFKAVGPSGLPASFKGSVYTNTGQKLVDFSSQHDGMGFFELQPQPGVAYSAKVAYDNGTNAEYKLPPAKKEGISLQVNNTAPSRLFILVERSEVNKQKYNQLYVVAQMDGLPIYKAALNFDAGESAASIPKKNLPGGIVQITVFNDAGMPLAERLAFIENYRVFEPNVSLQKINTNKRTPNNFSFQLDSTLSPYVSVLVADDETSPDALQRETIISSQLLTSDIHGFIHNPGYYFSNKEKSTLQNLDLLLMTQGWRRFTWKQINGEENIVLKYPVESYMNIKGKVTLTDRPDQPVKEGMVAFLIKAEDSTSILSNAYLTDKGEFMIDSLSFRQKALVSYQGTNNKKQQLPVDVKIYPSYIDSLTKTMFTTGINMDTLSSSNNAYIKNELSKFDPKGPGVLENITIKTKKLSPIDSLQQAYVSPFFENSDQTISIPEKQHYQNIWQFLNTAVPGFNVNPFQPGGVTNVSFKRHEGASLSDEDEDNRYIKFMLNEIPVATEVIDGLHPSDVALVKVYKGATAFVFGADAGAISIYTKKGVNSTAAYDKKFIKYEKKGFAYGREFYSPDYSKYPDLNKNVTDSRATLYWNPSIKPGKDKKYTIQFHNNDVAKSYRLIIQGIDSEGRLIYKEQLIK